LPAILIIALAIGSTFYERNVVQDELINQVGRLVGHETAKEVENILLQAAVDNTSVWAKIVY
jgi:hypothetical protein